MPVQVIASSYTDGAALSAGATGGNIVTVSCPKVRYAAIADQDRNGLRTLGLDFQPCLNTGDDEISIALT